MHFLMLIGQEALMIEDQQEVLQYILGVILSRGVQENKLQFHVLVQKLSIKLWQMLQQK
jgi:hypothetical protein